MKIKIRHFFFQQSNPFSNQEIIKSIKTPSESDIRFIWIKWVQTNSKSELCSPFSVVIFMLFPGNLNFVFILTGSFVHCPNSGRRIMYSEFVGFASWHEWNYSYCQLIGCRMFWASWILKRIFYNLHIFLFPQIRVKFFSCAILHEHIETTLAHLFEIYLCRYE